MKRCNGRLVAAVVFVAAILNLPGRAPAATVEAYLEVTQGIQYSGHPTEKDNSIPLVADRPTVVRVMVKVKEGPMRNQIESIDARLELRVAPATAEDPPTLVQAPTNKDEFLAFWKSDKDFSRSEENSTLNFKVPAADLKQGMWSFRVKVDLKYQNNVEMTGTGMPEKDLEAIEVRPVRVHLIPLTFKGGGNGTTYGPPLQDENDRAKVESFLRACFPVSSKLEVKWSTAKDLIEEDGGIPDWIDDKQSEGDPQTDVDEIIQNLKVMWMHPIEPGTPEDRFYYTFAQYKPHQENVRKLPYDHEIIRDASQKPIYGWSVCATGLGTASKEQEQFVKSFVHELGHMMGLPHADKPFDLDDQVGWDVFGGTDGPVKAHHAGFMTKGVIDEEIIIESLAAEERGESFVGKPRRPWVTPKHYMHCLKVLKKDPEERPLEGCESMDPQQDQPVRRALVVQGKMTPEGKGVAWLSPIFRFPWEISPTPAKASGPYTLEAVDDAGVTHPPRRFNAEVRIETKDENAGPTFGFFSVIVPFPPDREVKSIVIRKEGIQEPILRRSDDSRPLPKIELSVSSIPVGQRTKVTWKIPTTDNNELNNRVRYFAAYSRDRGTTFEPIKVNFRKQELEFDPGDFDVPKEEGQGLIRIFVSSGFKTEHFDIQLTQ